MVVLSHLFARRKLHKMLLRRQRSTSKVILDDLPARFKAGLVKYNNKVHDVFDLYLRTVAAHVYDTLGEDVTLPLSSTKLISSENFQFNSPAVTLDDKLQCIAQPFKACSAFAALSGNTDNRLYSSQDLISNIRYQVIYGLGRLALYLKLILLYIISYLNYLLVDIGTGPTWHSYIFLDWRCKMFCYIPMFLFIESFPYTPYHPYLPAVATVNNLFVYLFRCTQMLKWCPLSKLMSISMLTLTISSTMVTTKL